MPDSSVTDEFDARYDGQRLVTVCSTDHLHQLIDRGRREWVDEELWLGRLIRTSSQREMRHADLAAVGRRASLTPEQLGRVLAWNSHHHAPLDSLPGGQLLVTTRTTPDDDPRRQRPR
ncbi:hypothetical protein QRX60_30230 [Amycolatopsis mongoliensis]|uniref:Uncharacterized protein n=1 Tax=Amycolatopsis mongoliensis TaxID=715475 RepID=A0A9Y2NA82_9PSEU|nr:hypothetical protein [Amycolatopsis sp. 4-36]WIX98335.1 hypothetical protein QRX60_30230 [Amycolatopsis sp. 4-36]